MFPRLRTRRSVLGARGAARRSLTREHGRLQVADELAQQLVGDVGEDAPTELGDLAGDLQVGLDSHLRALTGGHERGSDRRVRVALATRLATFGPQHRTMGCLVFLEET